MKRRKKAFILLFIALVICISFAIYCVGVKNEPIYKTAIGKPEVGGKTFIIAIDYPVSGTDWLRVDNGFDELCNIVSITDAPLPNNALLKYDVSIRRNKFAFYVDSVDIENEIKTYYVSGWDVLRPVKHGDIIRDILHYDVLTYDDISTQ